MPDHLLTRSPNVMVDFRSAGSACGVWQDGLATYVLSAAHVFDAMAFQSPIRWISSDLTSSGGGLALTSQMWLPVPGGDLDAGLVQIDRPGPFRSGGDYPFSSQVLEWEQLSIGMVVQICGKQGEESAVLVAKEPAGHFFEGHRHGRLLKFRFLQFGTDPGDSGAAVLSAPEGMLVGMHIARDDRAAGVSFSLAVPAGDIRDAFAALRFGFDLRP